MSHVNPLHLISPQIPVPLKKRGLSASRWCGGRRILISAIVRSTTISCGSVNLAYILTELGVAHDS